LAVEGARLLKVGDMVGEVKWCQHADTLPQQSDIGKVPPVMQL
jgi:hypothetical protein